VVKPTVTSESEGETAPKQPKRRARKNVCMAWQERKGTMAANACYLI
jgi:hypothetical protein